MKDLYPNRRLVGNLSDTKDEIWKSLFKLDSKAFRQSGFKFDYTILTDGIGASIRFVSDRQSILNEKRKKKAKDSQKTAALANKSLSQNARIKKDKKFKEETER